MILALTTFEAKEQKKFETILENNLPKGTLKLHNTTKSIDFLTSVLRVCGRTSVAEDIVCFDPDFPHHEAYSIEDIIPGFGAKTKFPSILLEN